MTTAPYVSPAQQRSNAIAALANARTPGERAQALSLLASSAQFVSSTSDPRYTTRPTATLKPSIQTVTRCPAGTTPCSVPGHPDVCCGKDYQGKDVFVPKATYAVTPTLPPKAFKPTPQPKFPTGEPLRTISPNQMISQDLANRYNAAVAAVKAATTPAQKDAANTSFSLVRMEVQYAISNASAVRSNYYKSPSQPGPDFRSDLGWTRPESSWGQMPQPTNSISSNFAFGLPNTISPNHAISVDLANRYNAAVAALKAAATPAQKDAALKSYQVLNLEVKNASVNALKRLPAMLHNTQPAHSWLNSLLKPAPTTKPTRTLAPGSFFGPPSQGTLPPAPADFDWNYYVNAPWLNKK